MSGAPGVVESAATLRKSGPDYGNSTKGVNCTGPFELDSWKSGERLTLKRFDGYWDNELKAKSKEVDFIFMPDPSARMNAFKSGEVDGGWLIPSNAVSEFNASGAGQIYFGKNTVVNSLVATNPDRPLASLKFAKPCSRPLTGMPWSRLQKGVWRTYQLLDATFSLAFG